MYQPKKTHQVYSLMVNMNQNNMKLYLILDAAPLKKMSPVSRNTAYTSLKKTKNKTRWNATKVPPRQIFVQQGIHLRWGSPTNKHRDFLVGGFNPFEK